jgi:hydroxymethylpyrimidine/phosphomethylpyrimidine kinase
MSRPVVLTIAGLDPTSGAGITADLKTFEQFHVYGYGVLTANTIQNCETFTAPNWVNLDTIIQQLQIIFEEEIPSVIKIGLIENLEVLSSILTIIKGQAPDAYLIWDPIIRSSSGFEVHKKLDKKLLQEVLTQIDLLTPNIPEFDIIERVMDPRAFCDVYLKGWHGTDTKVVQDALFINKAQVAVFSSPKLDFTKHGTGCVLSSVIAAEIAHKKTLSEACESGFNYLKLFISSNSGELGYHG